MRARRPRSQVGQRISFAIFDTIRVGITDLPFTFWSFLMCVNQTGIYVSLAIAICNWTADKISTCVNFFTITPRMIDSDRFYRVVPVLSPASRRLCKFSRPKRSTCLFGCYSKVLLYQKERTISK